MKKMLNFLFWFLCVASSVAFAGNEEQVCNKLIIDMVGQHLGVKNFWLSRYIPSEDRNTEDQHNGGIIVAQVCKPSLQSNKVVMVAIAYKPEVGGKLDAEYDKYLFVAMVNVATKHIVSNYQKVMYGDSISDIDENSLMFDIVSYQLNKNTRAFGLRVQNNARRPSCAEADWDDELTLFVQKGKKLQPVFESTIFNQQSLKGCLSVQSTDAVWETTFSTIKVLNTRTLGYSDLLRTNKVETGGANGNVEYAKPRLDYCKLRYDGTKYISQKQCTKLQPNL